MHRRVQAMSSRSEIVITGLGIVSPLGIGVEPFWHALEQQTSGIGPLTAFDASSLPVHVSAEVRDFDPKQYVRPRKSLKVMARDSQLGVAAAAMAVEDAGVGGSVDPDRFGVIFGADAIVSPLSDSSPSVRDCVIDGSFHFDRWGSHGLFESFPLVFLKLLPNMIGSHIAIAHDARAANNTLHEGDVSGLMALGEAMRVIERGWADVVIAGGASARTQPFDWVRGCLTEQLSPHEGNPALASRPFDRSRNGQVRGEGAAVFVLEQRAHAEARRAPILAQLAGFASACEPLRRDQPPCGCSVRRAILASLRDAGLEAADIGHVNAHGLSTRHEDHIEAKIINELLGETPVTAPKSFFGNLSAGAGALELAVSVLALSRGSVPVTLNYTDPDPTCPVNVVRDQPLTGTAPSAVVVNHTTRGQAAALVVREA